MPRPYTQAELPAAATIAVSDKLLRLAASTEPHPYRAAVAQELQDGLVAAATVTKQAVNSRRTQDIVVNRYNLSVGPRNRFAAALCDGSAGPDGALWHRQRRRAWDFLKQADFDNYMHAMSEASRGAGGHMGSWQSSMLMGNLSASGALIPRIRQAQRLPANPTPLDTMLVTTTMSRATPHAQVNLNTASGTAAFASLPLFGAVEILWASGWIPRPSPDTEDASLAIALNLNPDRIANFGASTWTATQAKEWLASCAAPLPRLVVARGFPAVHEGVVWPFDPPPRPTTTTAATPTFRDTPFLLPPNGMPYDADGDENGRALRAGDIELTARLLGYSWLTPSLLTPDNQIRMFGAPVPAGIKVVIIDDMGALDFAWGFSSLSYDMFAQSDGRVSFMPADLRNNLGRTWRRDRHHILGQVRGRIACQRDIVTSHGANRRLYFLNEVINHTNMAQGLAAGNFDSHYREIMEGV